MLTGREFLTCGPVGIGYAKFYRERVGIDGKIFHDDVSVLRDMAFVLIPN